MQTESFQGILIPFLGTTLGSACVLFMKNRLNQMVQRASARERRSFTVCFPVRWSRWARR
ncbi:hypothetical protein AALB53_19845 [Lachnospiraceae bacterium 47-T17]